MPALLDSPLLDIELTLDDILGDKYTVIVYNDDVTPVSVVIQVTIAAFSISQEEAFEFVLKVHNEGKAAYGIFPKEEASQKASMYKARSIKASIDRV